LRRPQAGPDEEGRAERGEKVEMVPHAGTLQTRSCEGIRKFWHRCTALSRNRGKKRLPDWPQAGS
jgi:hypothetical protein